MPEFSGDMKMVEVMDAIAQTGEDAMIWKAFAFPNEEERDAYIEVALAEGWDCGEDCPFESEEECCRSQTVVVPGLESTDVAITDWENQAFQGITAAPIVVMYAMGSEVTGFARGVEQGMALLQTLRGKNPAKMYPPTVERYLLAGGAAGGAMPNPDDIDWDALDALLGEGSDS